MSSNRRFYITTAIPYVNGDPHLGHALELVQADVLARHRRLRGDDVRFLSGTDDNALKNVDAALAAGLPVAEFVAEKAQRFAELAGRCSCSNDDFIRTSTDPRHRPGVERLWRACAAAGDLYQRDYEGLYCSGCEAFLDPATSTTAAAPSTATPPERDRRAQLVLPALALRGRAARPDRERPRCGSSRSTAATRCSRSSRGGLADFSVSRAQERARGWGIPVPDDPARSSTSGSTRSPTTSPRSATARDGEAYATGGAAATSALHVIGKGIIRFHAVYWPAILLSAGEPLPTAIFVHDYLTVDGQQALEVARQRGRPGRGRRALRRRRAALVARARRAAQRRRRLPARS